MFKTILLFFAAVCLMGQPAPPAVPAPPCVTPGQTSCTPQLDANGNVTFPGTVSVGLTVIDPVRGVNTVPGVKCDGNTDDTAAFQTALTALTSGSALVANFPGTCIITTLTLAASDVSISGTVTLKQKTGTANTPMLYMTGVSNVTISGLTFDGNAANVSGNNASALSIVSSSKISLQNLTTNNILRIGVIVNGSTDIDINNLSGNNLGLASTPSIGELVQVYGSSARVRMNNLNATGTLYGEGVYITGTCTDVSVSNANLSGWAASNGLTAENSSRVSITNVVTSNNGSHGMELTGLNGLTLKNATTTGNTQYGVLIGTYAGGVLAGVNNSVENLTATGNATDLVIHGLTKSHFSGLDVGTVAASYGASNTRNAQLSFNGGNAIATSFSLAHADSVSFDPISAAKIVGFTQTDSTDIAGFPGTPTVSSILWSANPGDMACAHAADTTINAQSITGGSTDGVHATVTVASTAGFHIGDPINVVGATPAGVIATGNSTVISSLVANTSISYLNATGTGSISAAGTISLACGNQVNDALSATSYAYTNVYAVPASYFATALKSLTLQALFSIWTPATAPTFNPTLFYASTPIFSTAAAAVSTASQVDVAGSITWSMLALDAANDVYTSATSGILGSNTSNAFQNFNKQPVVLSASQSNVGPRMYFTASGTASAVCNDAGNACGLTGLGSNATGTTVKLQTFNGTGCVGVLGTVALTGTGVIANGTALTMTNTGYACTGTSTTAAYVAGGTATGVSGSAAITSVLGGATGVAFLLRGFGVRQN